MYSAYLAPGWENSWGGKVRKAESTMARRRSHGGIYLGTILVIGAVAMSACGGDDDDTGGTGGTAAAGGARTGGRANAGTAGRTGGTAGQAGSGA
jgi:hypothetical protein